MLRLERMGCGLVLLVSLGGGCAGPARPSQVSRADEAAPSSAVEPAVAPATASASASGAAPSGSIAAADPAHAQDLDSCILQVLRDPFPGQSVPPGRYYPDAVEAFAKGNDVDTSKLFSETYLFDGTKEFIPMGHFGHGEIERRAREPIHRHFAIGRYDRILALKTPHPVRELTLLRKAQALAATGKPDAALATLAELDPRSTLGRCDASIRTAMVALLGELAAASSKLEPRACTDARTVADRLGVESARKAVASRCPS